MNYLAYGLIIVLCCIWLGYVTVQAVDCIFECTKPKAWLVLAVLSWSLLVAGIAYSEVQEGNKGPCLRYETSMYFNASTKTMLPARRCAERAEWVQ
jgi:hypothetical protein